MTLEQIGTEIERLRSRNAMIPERMTKEMIESLVLELCDLRDRVEVLERTHDNCN